ncbi:hypothetical protein PENNAL_c0362G09585 [Penicillium nalgiovense]|uniref:Uncharacterized protein n=1 Tax=Penicillium nalgiovense TaxID=60175 RepID=A0A1V6VEL0_PENNA|nr:hypothetical protein PENNAL_c0552G00005 [Penicillium nalgiovense]OQE58272.1 hypothetical protein PENNAL_c0377G11428 [Penicillium nalgiovense]OQE58763.1 hypothetical protein PENNAL_c0362G09585 [Penicillium nalgiovense]
MTEMPTAPRNPAVPAPTRVRKTRASASRPVRPLPASADNIESNPTPGEAQFRKRLRAHASRPEDHVECIKWLEAAEQAHQQNTARLNERGQQLVAEKNRLSVKVEQLTAEKHKAAEEGRRWKSEIVALKESLGAATSQDHMPREEYKQALRELQNTASSLTGQITDKMNESDHAYFSTLLPSSDVAQDWQDQDASYLLDPSNMPSQPLSGYSSNLPTIPQLDSYPHLP